MKTRKYTDSQCIICGKRYLEDAETRASSTSKWGVCSTGCCEKRLIELARKAAKRKVRAAKRCRGIVEIGTFSYGQI
jgi:PHP family Zn ribbon phosphoesterase